MNKLLSTLALLACGLIVLLASAPALARLVNSLVPLVVISGVIAIAIRLVWWYTQRW